MRRFLFVMWEGGGTVPPELGVARRLIARGHRVHVLGDPTIEPGARQIGASFTSWRDALHVTSLRPEDALLKDWEYTNPLTLFRAARDTILCGPTAAFARETLAAIAEFRPDVVAPDMVLLGAQIAAEKGAPAVCRPRPQSVPDPFAWPPRARIGTGARRWPIRTTARCRDAHHLHMERLLTDGRLSDGARALAARLQRDRERDCAIEELEGEPESQWIAYR